ncbi:OPT oligopeptide transporter protein-domain-containing protein [Podospora appendiculata]|uniref:OPT oligopeptide transporter protein-domain-containing protein n=1 Tax=Podospora appendiculata TaxID=314037 RepID=A0AAE0XAK9_9PEZI|nr:OPT oligopeptide transporter protein-domain-containing protein [Podospora appendiculata]
MPLHKKEESPPGAPLKGVAAKPEKDEYHTSEVLIDGDIPLDHAVESELNVTERELNEAKAIADEMTLDEVRNLMKNVFKIHEFDPNFPHAIIDKTKEFLDNEDIVAHPEQHAELIYEMKLEAALITNNSPYSEVRSVVDNFDNPNTPCATIRAWVIGLVFSCLLGFINQLFSIRMPNISIGSNVAQLLAFPIGKFCERVLPDWGFTFWGVRHSLNPGRFSKKEHMLITIMANVAGSTPYTNNIIWSQYLRQYFNQSYAGEFTYQILIALSTNLVGYGMAGLTRRFLVYPAYCVWPASLVTIALNTAFHEEDNQVVEGPFRRMYRVTRYKFFLLAFGAMFVWFWLPNYLFQALSIFSWITWISPNNRDLSAIAGFQNGLGFNPWPTFDWNILSFDGTDPLMVPYFSTVNKFIGMFFSAFVVIAVWYTNTYNTAYLPINSNRVFDNTGNYYNVSRAIDRKGLFDAAKYKSYSPAFLTAANLTTYGFFFAIYPATITYIILNHRYEVTMGLKNLWNSLLRKKTSETGEYNDVHNRLMARYLEVPEWWYFVLLVVAIACGIGGIAGWETYTTPAVVFYGLVLCLIFVIPVGIVKAMTGIEVTLNVLAEFIGGAWVEGNALAMNFFKSFGYVTCAHAVWFANDLKLAHYVKIPPRQTFMAQVIATLISTFICVGVLNFQMNDIPNVCTKDAPNKMTCPGINTFFTASVLWGTIGPKKVFGVGGQYTALMVGWPLGVVVAVAIWWLQRRFKAQKWMRQIHPIALLYGAIYWAPYNLSYVTPSLAIGWVSWIWCKNRFLGFWAKYNFVLSAAFTTGISIAAIVIFFAMDWNDVKVDWWGNNVIRMGCEDEPCVLKTLADGEYFGPGPGQFA